MTSDETYEFDIEEGWTEPKQPESGTAGGHKPNGGGQSSPSPTDAAWPIPDPAMFHGLAGEVVATIIPNTEADAVALLVNYHAYLATSSAAGHFSRSARQITSLTSTVCWSARPRHAKERPRIA